MFKLVKNCSLVKKIFAVLTGLGLLVFFLPVFADTVNNVPTPASSLGDVATNVSYAFSAIGQLMIAIAYVAGLGFGVAAIFKFKQHKDNPTQIPLGTPIALLVIAIALVFLPSFFSPAGETLFGKTTGAGGPTGQGAQCLPGWSGTTGSGSC